MKQCLQLPSQTYNPKAKTISSEKKTLSVRNCIYVIQAQTDQSMQNIASVIVGGQCLIEKLLLRKMFTCGAYVGQVVIILLLHKIFSS